MIYIEFKRWGAGPIDADIYEVEWPAVPRVGETVHLPSEITGIVRKVEWHTEDEGECTALGIAVVWLER